jgi:hypothetical protein
MFLCLVSIITSVECIDDNDCSNVDGYSICDTITATCVCKTGFAVTGIKCERMSNRDVSRNVLFIKHLRSLLVF